MQTLANIDIRIVPVELQDSINRQVYHRRGVEQTYTNKSLVAAETAALLAYQPAFFGKDVLDIGVGTGRTSKFLAPLANRYLGIDYSEPMLEEARGRCPGVDLLLLDMQEIATLGTEKFDFLFAPNNVIDAASAAGRDRILGGFFTVLKPSGILAFSSHNLRYGEAFDRPRLHGSPNPVKFARNLQQYARQVVNHRRVGRYRRVESDHAILNDEGHDYSLLHYYIDRFGSELQLNRAGFDLMTIIDDSGSDLRAGDLGEDSASLLYVARRRHSNEQKRARSS